MMAGLSCLTFVLIVFCCYATSMSKPARNETNKPVDAAHLQEQHRQLQSEATYETRQKRSEFDFGDMSSGEHKDFNEFAEKLDDERASPILPDEELDNLPPLVYFMLLQRIKQLQNNERQLPARRTPRLGRSIDFELFDGGVGTSAGHDFARALNVANDYALSRHLLPRIMKKSVQFKPRLGKRTQMCD